MTNQEKVLALAMTQKGVKEFVNGSNPQIEAYHKMATEKNDKGSDDSIPWCSSFMCWAFESAGFLSTNSRAARSWLKYGKPTKAPKLGDLVIFWRGAKTAATGHVALFSGYDKNGNIMCFGGNQNDSVCYQVYPKERLLGFRTY